MGLDYVSNYCEKIKRGIIVISFWQHGTLNTLRPRQNDADDIFKCIFLNENIWISIKISLKFVPKGPINNIPLLVQIMAWHRSGDKPLFEPVMESLLTHICVTRPQWVNFTPGILLYIHSTRCIVLPGVSLHRLQRIWQIPSSCCNRQYYKEVRMLLFLL